MGYIYCKPNLSNFVRLTCLKCGKVNVTNVTQHEKVANGFFKVSNVCECEKSDGFFGVSIECEKLDEQNTMGSNI